MPEVLVIGGPNGAGKSTFARYVLPEALPFLNADEIAKTLPERFSGNRDLEAGRLLLARIDALSAQGRSFAIETTLASRSLIPRLRSLRDSGYTVVLIYVWLPSPELAVERVALRVLHGGHDIPKATIYRRYRSSLRNLIGMYMPLAREWRMYSNLEIGLLRLIASKLEHDQIDVHDEVSWLAFQQSVANHGE